MFMFWGVLSAQHSAIVSRGGASRVRIEARKDLLVRRDSKPRAKYLAKNLLIFQVLIAVQSLARCCKT
jgi:hypothetical protein